VRCSAKEPRANGVPVPEFDVPKAVAQAGVCDVLAAGGVRRSTGRKVVTESQRQRESCASLDLCGANAYCSISSSLIWSAEECGAEIVKYVPACRAHHPGDLCALGKVCPAWRGQNLACAACRRYGPACDVGSSILNHSRAGCSPTRVTHIHKEWLQTFVNIMRSAH